MKQPGGGDRALGAAAEQAAERLPRARPDLLLGDLADVHRADVHAARPENIADKAQGSGEYPQLSAEYIIASNPDLIVLADTVCCGQTRATVAARPGWSNIAAVKSGDVVPVDDSIASEWGPRIVLFLKAVAERRKEARRAAR